MELFRYENREVRTVLVDDAPWFVAADVCAILGYNHTPHAIRRLDPDEYQQTTFSQVAPNVRLAHPGPPPRPMTIVNEPGLYNLILGSGRPDARKFKRWLMHEVLPAIRRTGSYGRPAPDDRAHTALAAAAEQLATAQAQLSAVLAHLAGTVGAPPAHIPPAPVPVDPIMAAVDRWVRNHTTPAYPGTPARELFEAYTRHVDYPLITETRFGLTLSKLGHPAKSGPHRRYRPLVVKR